LKLGMERWLKERGSVFENWVKTEWGYYWEENGTRKYSLDNIKMSDVMRSLFDLESETAHFEDLVVYGESYYRWGRKKRCINSQDVFNSNLFGSQQEPDYFIIFGRTVRRWREKGKGKIIEAINFDPTVSFYNNLFSEIYNPFPNVNTRYDSIDKQIQLFLSQEKLAPTMNEIAQVQGRTRDDEYETKDVLLLRLSRLRKQLPCLRILQACTINSWAVFSDFLHEEFGLYSKHSQQLQFTANKQIRTKYFIGCETTNFQDVFVSQQKVFNVHVPLKFISKQQNAPVREADSSVSSTHYFTALLTWEWKLYPNRERWEGYGSIASLRFVGTAFIEACEVLLSLLCKSMMSRARSSCPISVTHHLNIPRLLTPVAPKAIRFFGLHEPPEQRKRLFRSLFCSV